MSSNRVRYLQESFDSAFYQLQFSRSEQKMFIGKLAGLLAEDAVAPKAFFDLQKNIEIYARKHGLSHETARGRIFENPEIICDLHGVLHNKPVMPAVQEEPAVKKSFMPSDKEIAAIILKMKTELGHGPDKNKDGHKNLPEGSFGWGYIYNKLQERGLNFTKLVKKELGVSLNKARVPSDEQIARIALEIKQKYNRLPHANGYEGLPEGSTGWGNIAHKFRERNITLRQVIAQHQHKFPELTKPLPKIAEAPQIPKKGITPEDIEISARKTLNATGRRPTGADGLIKYGPLKNKYTWVSVHRAFERGTHGLHKSEFRSLAEFLDSKDLPKPYEPANKVKLDHDLIVQSARAMLHDPAFQRRPNAADGDIIHGPLAGKGNWNNIHQVLAREGKASNGTSVASLSALLNANNIPKRATRDTPARRPKQVEETFSIHEAFVQYANYVREKPHLSVPHIGPMEAPLEVMDKAFREGKIEGMERFVTRPFIGVIDFMVATGFLERRENKIVAAPLPKINFLVKTYV